MFNLRQILKFTADAACESLGHPVKLIRLLAEHPTIRVKLNTPPLAIDVRSVVNWHTLSAEFGPYPGHGQRGTLLGWRSMGGCYNSFTRHFPEYEQLGHLQITKDWTCELQDVGGFSASKSDLANFATTDEMVEADSREMIESITSEKLAEALAHKEIRIIHAPGRDWFKCSRWDGRIFLMNEGGSHHLAAAKYIAARLHTAVPLKGTLHTFSLNAAAIASLQGKFEMFAISDVSQISIAFKEAMESCQATWYTHSLPEPFNTARAILLPKTEPRSMKVANLLRRAGVVDLGQHLADLAAVPPKNLIFAQPNELSE